MSVDSGALQDALKKYFGFDDFLDNQLEVVQAITDGGDCCIIMPTGAGKSLCYQLPIMLKKTYGIVVSPLIALMKDQIDSLREKSIPAAAINSSIDYYEQREILSNVANGSIKLLYVAPERFTADSFMAFLEKFPPEILVVDEAHCISQWGHDFRPAYAQLGHVCEHLKIPQVCAFTATATPRVREDIKEQLRRPEMIFHVAGFKRPNLAFKVLECRGNDAKLDAVKELLEEKTPGATIIYAATRKQVDELTGALNIPGYHAGMSDEERTLVQDDFMTQKNPVLVATNAFGMGIDRSDVRRVIHYNITSSLEAYYQEAGRAGRDGEPSECILLFSYADRYVQEFLVEMSNPPPELLKRLYTHLVRAAEKSNSSTLEIQNKELALLLDAKNDAQIYSALRILEHYGKISRYGRSDNAGTLQLRGNAVLLEQMHASEKTQRSRFIHRVLSQYGLNRFQATFQQLAELTGLKYDQLRRVMNFLNGDVLSWQPVPPGSGVISLSDCNEKELNIDFSKLERKRAFELGKLEDVIAFAQTRNCRQAALISYFGEKTDHWQCACCDNCDHNAQLKTQCRNLSESELDAAVSILECVKRFNGRFGRGKLSLILCGARRSELQHLNVQQSSHFGVLRSWKQDQILDFLRALEKAGLLTTSGGDYPCLMTTPEGEDFIDCPENIMLDLKKSTEAPARQRQSRKASTARQSATTVSFAHSDRRVLERSGLRDELKKKRTELAEKMHLRPFMIFSDAVLEELILKMPLTAAEALRIKGIGERKAEMLQKNFLPIIEKYRQENLS